MRVCILCEDSNLQKVKENMKNQNILTIPLSATGILPATYWFCCIATTEDKANKLVASANLTTIEISEPNVFLDKWKLKIIE